MDDVSTKKPKWFLIAGSAVLFILALYAAVGFWVAPRIVQSKGSQLVKEKTGLNLTFQKVRLNPFVFTAVFEGLSLGRAGEAPFLTVAELHADFELRSLVAPPYRFTSIRLVSAVERLELLPDGGIDYAPLFDELLEQTKRSRRRGTPPQVLVERMSVETSRIQVVDPARLAEPIITVDQLSAEFANLSTVKGQAGTYDLRGTVVDIGTIHDRGNVSLAPLRLDGHVEIGPLQLRPIWMLMGDRFGVDVADGSMRADVDYALEINEGGTIVQVRDGNATISGLQFADAEQSFKFGSLSELAIRGIDIDTAQKTASVESVSATDPELTAWIRQDGTSGFIDALALKKTGRSLKEMNPGAPGLPAIFDGWTARLVKAEARNTIFRFEDQSNEPVVKAEIASIPMTRIEGVSIGTGTKRLDIQNVVVEEPSFFVRLNREGTFRLARIFGLTASDPGTGPGVSEKSTAVSGVTDWQVNLGQAEVRDATLIHEDRTFTTPMKQAFYPVNGKVSGWSFPQQQPAAVSLDVVGEGGGTLALSGTAGIQPTNADLTVSLNRLALRQLQPVADTTSRLKITSGTMDVIGRAMVQKETQGPRFRFDGQLSVSDVELVDTGSDVPVLRHEGLQVNGIRFDVKPNRLIISEVVNRRLYIYLVIEEDGSTNLENALDLADENVEAVEKSALGQLATVISRQIRGPVPTRVDAITLEDGMVDVTHNLPRATFTLKLDHVDVRLGNIDTDSDNLKDVLVSGRIDEEAPFEYGGTINLFADEMTADMTLLVKNYNLVNANPYARRYLGYGINRGKVDMELDYTVKNNYVTGKNEFDIRRFELGEKTGSPDAIDAPVEMSVAMLKDRQGNIRLEVPVEGDIKDPEFRIDSIVADTMVGMVGTVVTSPFKILGGIAGTASPDELRMVNFRPGAEDLDEPERQKLSQLAAAFKERPGLSLQIKGTVSPKLDRPLLAIALLRSQTKRTHGDPKTSGAGVSGNSSLEDDRHQLLADMYRKNIGTLPPSLEEPGPETNRDLENALIERIEISDDRFRKLAKQRAEVVKEYLLESGGIEPDRVFVVAPVIQDPETAESVPVIMSLLPR